MSTLLPTDLPTQLGVCPITHGQYLALTSQPATEANLAILAQHGITYEALVSPTPEPVATGKAYVSAQSAAFIATGAEAPAHKVYALSARL